MGMSAPGAWTMACEDDESLVIAGSDRAVRSGSLPADGLDGLASPFDNVFAPLSANAWG